MKTNRNPIQWDVLVIWLCLITFAVVVDSYVLAIVVRGLGVVIKWIIGG